jgi:hypothetical protein
MHSLTALICVLALADGAPSRTPESANNSHGATSLFAAGARWQPEEAAAAERTVAEHPDDFAARAGLLGYYKYKSAASAGARSARLSHLRWMIEHHPEAEGLDGWAAIAELDGADAWQATLADWKEAILKHPKNPRVLLNGSQWVQVQEPAAAEAMLATAIELAPFDADPVVALASLQENAHGRDEASTRAAALRALPTMEAALARGIRDEYLFSHAAKGAFAAGKLDEATLYANQVLAGSVPDTWSYGDYIQTGNSILGRVALAKGDVESAGRYLLRASDTTKGSPVLNSFGPNMQLAKDLLRAGAKDVVLRHLEQCRRFWKSDKGKLDRWAGQIRAGEMPEFGANLIY